MPWLDEQAPEALRQWLRRTHIPMLSTVLDGDILWANHAFEELLGYNTSELYDGMSWENLTVGHSDLGHDKAMAEEVASGHRTDYQIVKEYKHKTGEAVPVNIHVLRYPLMGDFQCFLVSVYSLKHGGQVAAKELQSLHKTVLKLVDMQTKQSQAVLNHPDLLTTMAQYAKEHPRIAGSVGLILALRFAGFSVPEILKLITHGLGVMQ